MFYVVYVRFFIIVDNDRFMLFYLYFPENHKTVGTEEARRHSKDWKDSLKALKITIIYSFTIFLASLSLVLCYGVPSTAAMTWTAILAFVAVVASLIQFIPQIMRTWKLKVSL